MRFGATGGFSTEKKSREPANYRSERLPRPEGHAEAKKPTITRGELSEDQAFVYDAVLTWMRDPNARQWLTMGGLAGTGKTTVTSALLNDMKGLSVACGAYTGKASNVLRQKLEAQGLYPDYCGTLHGMMYRPQVDEKTGKVIGWERIDDLPFDLIVIDEASMVNEQIWNDVVAYGIPILAVGDHGQLPPVGGGNISLMTEPDLRLEKIHRQAAGNPILELAHHIRRGNPVHTFRPADERVTFVRTFPEVKHIIADGGMDAVAICYFNKTRVALNTMVRAARGFQGPQPDPGDIVFCLKNQNKLLFNGMRGIVREMAPEVDDKHRLVGVIDFPDDYLRIKEAKLNYWQFNRDKTFDDFSTIPNGPTSWHEAGLLFDFGYAGTCHKMQGSGFKHVVVRWETFFKDTADTRARWGYTAATRAIERLWIVK